MAESEFATKADLLAMKAELLSQCATKDDLRRLAVQFANLTIDVAELKERIPTREYFSKLMGLMDRMAASYEDHERRIARLEAEKRRPS